MPRTWSREQLGRNPPSTAFATVVVGIEQPQGVAPVNIPDECGVNAVPEKLLNSTAESLCPLRRHQERHVLNLAKIRLAVLGVDGDPRSTAAVGSVSMPEGAQH